MAKKDEAKETNGKKKTAKRRASVEATPANVKLVREKCRVSTYSTRAVEELFKCNFASAVILIHEARKEDAREQK